MSTEKSKNVVITKKARENLVKARAGAITLPKIIGMAFGEGGVNSSGTVIAPAESQSRLNKELFRKAIDGYTFPNDTTCRYECTLAESELAGKEISEIGLYDTNGDIVCIKTFTRKGKDDDIEQTYVLDDILSPYFPGNKKCQRACADGVLPFYLCFCHKPCDPVCYGWVC